MQNKTDMKKDWIPNMLVVELREMNGYHDSVHSLPDNAVLPSGSLNHERS